MAELLHILCKTPMNQSINSSQMRPTLFQQDHSQIGTAGTHDGQHPDHHDKCAGTDD